MITIKTDLLHSSIITRAPDILKYSKCVILIEHSFDKYTNNTMKAKYITILKF